MLGDGDRLAIDGASGKGQEASKAGALPLERAPGPSPHQACPVGFPPAFLGAAASSGPGFLPPPRPGSGPAPAAPSFLVRVPGEAAELRWPVLPGQGAPGRALPACLPGRAGAPGPASAWPPLSGFQGAADLPASVVETRAVVSGCPLTSLPCGPWRRLLEDRVRPSPCPREVQPLAGGHPQMGNLEHASTLACTQGQWRHLARVESVAEGAPSQGLRTLRSSLRCSGPRPAAWCP